MAVPARRGGAATTQLRVAQADPHAAEPDPVSQDPDPGACSGGQPAAQGLEDTGIKLDCVATDILGKSGRAMLDALVSGTTDPEILAELAKGKLARRSRRSRRP